MKKIIIISILILIYGLLYLFGIAPGYYCSGFGSFNDELGEQAKICGWGFRTYH